MAGLITAMCVAERISVVSTERPTRFVQHLNGKSGMLMTILDDIGLRGLLVLTISSAMPISSIQPAPVFCSSAGNCIVAQYIRQVF
jgi:ACT domain-containing protein